MTAAEAKNPKKSLPRAIKGVAVRIALFYILGVLVIGLLVPSNNPRLNLNSHDATSSPFVIAIEKSGIKSLPS
jgi:amino acid transporter